MGGWATTKTQKTILNPGLIPELITVIKEFERKFNASLINIPGIKFIKPLGSSAHYKEDIQHAPDYVYGDIDYLVSFPLFRRGYDTKREQENQSISFYKKKMIEFIKTCDNIDNDTLKGNGNYLIFKLSDDRYVQIDILATTPDYVDWCLGRFTPERGLKGLSYGYLYSAFNEIYKINISDRGVLVRLKDDKLVTGKLRKGVDIKTITTDYGNFWMDTLKWCKYRIDPERTMLFTHHKILLYPGVKEVRPVQFKDIIMGMKGFIVSLELNGLLENEMFPEPTAKGMIDLIRYKYLDIMDSLLDDPKYEKAESDELLKNVSKHIQRAKNIVNEYLIY